MSRLARQLRSKAAAAAAARAAAAPVPLAGGVPGNRARTAKDADEVKDALPVLTGTGTADERHAVTAPSRALRKAAEPAAEPAQAADGADPVARAEAWFAARGWQIFPFQRDVWQAVREGRSGLLHATTGAGKTYAAWFGAMLRSAGVRHAASWPGAGLLPIGTPAAGTPAAGTPAAGTPAAGSLAIGAPAAGPGADSY